MATCKIKKGDTVKVIAGKDKDREGKVITRFEPTADMKEVKEAVVAAL